MTLYLYLFIIFLNLLVAFRKRQSKVLTIFTLIIILLFISGAGPNYKSLNHSRDYVNYEISYKKSNYIGILENPQIGYTILMKIGNLLNLDFFTFRMITIAICLMLIYKKVIKKYAYNSNYILAIYMIYPMIIDSEHFRNFIAMTIFLVSIKFLESNLAKDKIKFLMLILIAASIHTAFIFYVPLIIVKSNYKNKIIKWIAISTVIFTVLIFLNNNQLPFIHLLVNLFEDARVIRYLSSKTRFGFLIPVALHLTSIIIVAWSRKIIIRKNSKMDLIDGFDKDINRIKKSRITDIEFANLIFWINIIGIIFFPLFIMSVTFYRLAKNLLILNFIVYSKVSNELKKGSIYKLTFNSLVVISLIIWLILDLVIKTSPERVLIPFFTQNLFLN